MLQTRSYEMCRLSGNLIQWRKSSFDTVLGYNNKNKPLLRYKFGSVYDGLGPRCYIPRFMEIGPPVLEKNIFDCFFTIYGRGGHLGHVTWILRSNFHHPYPWMLHIKLAKRFRRRKSLKSVYVRQTGQGQAT